MVAGSLTFTFAKLSQNLWILNTNDIDIKSDILISRYFDKHNNNDHHLMISKKGWKQLTIFDKMKHYLRIFVDIVQYKETSWG